MKSGASVCDNNQVDADAILEFTLAELRGIISRSGGREVLREKLLAKVEQNRTSAARCENPARNALKNRVEELTRKMETVTTNFAFATEPGLREALQNTFGSVKRELEQAKSALASLPADSHAKSTPAADVEKAMKALDMLENLISISTTRAKLPQLGNPSNSLPLLPGWGIPGDRRVLVSLAPHRLVSKTR
jgi:hypothetical protein